MGGGTGKNYKNWRLRKITNSPISAVNDCIFCARSTASFSSPRHFRMCFMPRCCITEYGMGFQYGLGAVVHSIVVGLLGQYLRARDARCWYCSATTNRCRLPAVQKQSGRNHLQTVADTSVSIKIISFLKKSARKCSFRPWSAASAILNKQSIRNPSTTRFYTLRTDFVSGSTLEPFISIEILSKTKCNYTTRPWSVALLILRK